MNYANVFTEIGYHVVFIGADNCSDMATNGLVKTKVLDYDVWNFECSRRLRYKINDFLGTKNVLSVVSKYDDVQAIIFYNYRSIPFLRMVYYCRKNDIKVISNTTEWYASKSGKNIGFQFVKNLDTALRMKVVNNKVDGLIVTSSFLKDFYKGSEVVVVPSLSESASESAIRLNPIEAKDSRETIRFIYAGNPFSNGTRIKDRSIMKDRLDKAIGYFYRVFVEGYDFQFDIYGLTREQYLNSLPEDQSMLDALEGRIFFHGFVRSDVVCSAIRNADFTVLIRDVNRVTLAGFPTKIAESINLGIPVLTTRLGDMDKYVNEDKTGFFFRPDNDDYNISVVRRVLAMDRDEIESMKKCCRESTVFRWVNWVSPISEFLNRLWVD